MYQQQNQTPISYHHDQMKPPQLDTGYGGYGGMGAGHGLGDQHLGMMHPEGGQNYPGYIDPLDSPIMKM